MIDISKFIREQFSADQLEHHIFNNKGGNSVAMLKRLLEPNSMISSAFDSVKWDQCLKQYGPALVSQFEVFDDFADQTTHVHHGSSTTGQSRGMHSMVLVGARKEGGKHYFLLQNWWKQKQFVEVDVDYMESRGATIYFVKTPQTKIPKSFPQTHGIFAENEMDKEEDYMMEDY